MLPYFLTSLLPYLHTSLPPYFLTTLLPYSLTSVLPYFRTSLLPCFFPYFLISLLPYFLTSLLPYFLTFFLPSLLISLPPYILTLCSLFPYLLNSWLSLPSYLLPSYILTSLLLPFFLLPLPSYSFGSSGLRRGLTNPSFLPPTSSTEVPLSQSWSSGEFVLLACVGFPPWGIFVCVLEFESAAQNLHRKRKILCFHWNKHWWTESDVPVPKNGSHSSLLLKLTAVSGLGASSVQSFEGGGADT